MKNVMKRAWEIARDGQKKFGGKVVEYFAIALKMAWAEYQGFKETVAKMKEVNAEHIRVTNKPIVSIDLDEGFAQEVNQDTARYLRAINNAVLLLQRMELQLRKTKSHRGLA